MTVLAQQEEPFLPPHSHPRIRPAGPHVSFHSTEQLQDKEEPRVLGLGLGWDGATAGRGPRPVLLLFPSSEQEGTADSLVGALKTASWVRPPRTQGLLRLRVMPCAFGQSFRVVSGSNSRLLFSLLWASPRLLSTPIPMV